MLNNNFKNEFDAVVSLNELVTNIIKETAGVKHLIENVQAMITNTAASALELINGAADKLENDLDKAFDYIVDLHFILNKAKTEREQQSRAAELSDNKEGGKNA